MDIISVEALTDPSLMKFKVGGAALVFEKVEDWKHHFKNLIPNACQAVQDNRTWSKNRDDRMLKGFGDRLRSGDILYASLVHAVVQMIDAFVRDREPLSASRVNIPVCMSFTRIWKQDAELEPIVEMAVRFLSLYKDVSPSDPHLKAKLLVEFEVVWREIISPFLDVDPLLCKHFSDGGYLSQELFGPDLYTILTDIRKKIIQNRKREEVAASSSSASISLTG